jgi:sulfonate transport system ATP-binding protein
MVVAAPVLGAVALADRVLIIEDGRIAWDIDIDLKRRRERGSADVAALEGTILRELLRTEAE